jgi:hypothetical protein
MGPIPIIILGFCTLNGDLKCTNKLRQKFPGTQFAVLYNDQCLQQSPVIVFENVRDLGPEQHGAPVKFVGLRGSDEPVQGKYYDIDLE